MSVVGIDFGNLNTVVAVARNRGIDVITNEVSNRATPSLVSFGDKQRYMGEAAKTQEISIFKSTVSTLKRLIGRPFSDPEILAIEQKFVNAKLVASDRGEVGAEITFQGESRTFSATQLAAMFFGKVKEFTQKEIKGPMTDCVISCPGWYNDRQRRAIRDAAEIAGLNCLRVLNDLTAAALGYGITKLDLPDPTVNPSARPRNVIFVDLGHSSYQVSIVSFVKGKLVVKSAAYDHTL
ncbi:adenyl-nucleotide exchange factor sse1, partial [Cladochytrium tenue]